MRKIYWRNFAGKLLGLGVSFILTFNTLPIMDVSASSYDNNGEEVVYYGDVNNDNKIDAKDVTVLRRHLAGGWNVEIDLEKADINVDNKVDFKDVTLLRRYLAGGWGVVLPEYTDEVIFPVDINETNFPDEMFRNYILENIDISEDGKLSEEEAGEITQLHLWNIGMSDIKGIKYFYNVTFLDVAYNNLSTLDVSKNQALEILCCSNNKLTVVDISKNQNLYRLDCGHNPLEIVAISNNPGLKELECMDSGLSALDISKNPLLESLTCSNNLLTSLDTGNNPELTFLNCDFNNIENLSLSNNTKLTHLECGWNSLLSLDLSALSELEYLYCSGNKELDDIDVSNNLKLTTLSCEATNISSLDIRKNIALVSLNCKNNSDLKELDISNNSNLKYFNHDDDLVVIGKQSIDNLFDDGVFKEYVKANIDTNKDGYLDKAEMDAVEEIDISGTEINSQLWLNIFNNLEKLDCSNTGITGLSVNDGSLKELRAGGNPNLRFITCGNNNLTLLDMSGDIGLEQLDCYSNQLTELDLKEFVSLKRLVCYSNNLTSLDIGKNTLLETMDCRWNPDLKELDITNNKELKRFEHDGALIVISENGEYIDRISSLFSDQELADYVKSHFDLDKDGNLDEDEIDAVTEIDISWTEIYSLVGIEIFENLEKLNCSNTNVYYISFYNTNLKELYAAKNKNLKTINCYNNKLAILDAHENPSLENVSVGRNELTAINVSGCSALKELRCDINKIDKLDLKDLVSLENLYCGANKLKEIDVTENKQLKDLRFYSNELTSINLSQNAELVYLDCQNNKDLTEIDITNNGLLKCIWYDRGLIIKGKLNIDIVFEDALFNEYVRTNIDIDKDGMLTQSEMDAVKKIDVSGMDIESLDRVWMFYYLEKLDCSRTKISELDIEEMQVKELYVTDCDMLTELWCYSNSLTALDVSGCISLIDLECDDNNLDSIDVSGLTKLEEFWCDGNNISVLDLKSNTALKKLYCGYNPLTSLDVSHNPELEYLDCRDSQVKELDLRNNPKLHSSNTFTDEGVIIHWYRNNDYSIVSGELDTSVEIGNIVIPTMKKWGDPEKKNQDDGLVSASYILGNLGMLAYQSLAITNVEDYDQFLEEITSQYITEMAKNFENPVVNSSLFEDSGVRYGKGNCIGTLSGQDATVVIYTRLCGQNLLLCLGIIFDDEVSDSLDTTLFTSCRLAEVIE